MQHTEASELVVNSIGIGYACKSAPKKKSGSIWELAARNNAKPMVVKVNGKIINK